MTADIHFSPLALTHALPFLPLAQGDIDYQVDRRSEPGLIDELLAEPTTKVVLTRGGLVAVPRGQGELVDYENVKMRLATLPGAYVSAELARYPEAVAMFLGSYVGARGESVVARGYHARAGSRRSRCWRDCRCWRCRRRRARHPGFRHCGRRAGQERHQRRCCRRNTAAGKRQG